MAVLAMIVLDDTQLANAMAVEHSPMIGLNPRQIDNALSNSLGHGTMVGLWVITARTLIDPAYAVYADWYAAQDPQPPIYVLDSDTLFVPDPDE